MRIGILVPGPVPYAFGGSERVARGLAMHLSEAMGHEAEVVMPASPEHDLRSLLASYRMWAELDVGEFDGVVSTKYPSWMVRHPRHVVHMQHALRGLYDTYPPSLAPFVESSDPQVRELLKLIRRPPERSALSEVFERAEQLLERLPGGHELMKFPGPLARELVHYLDRVGLDPRETAGHFGISATVAIKRSYFPPGCNPEVLVPPSNLHGFRNTGYEYLFTASRLDRPKRIDLIIRAMRHVRQNVRLVIAGTGPEEARLRALAREDHRVELIGHVDDEELLDLYADALAVPFVPADEDLGLITIEAQMSSKPVVTCRDSGGPTELVIDGLDGAITAATPEAIGAALQSLAGSPETARRMGEGGLVRARRITWDRVATTLLDAMDRPRPRMRHPGRPKVVVPSTYPVHPPLGGGQLRAHHLYKAVARGVDVEIVSLAPIDHVASRVVHAPGFTETIIPKSSAHDLREHAASLSAGIPVTDIVAGALAPLTPRYVEALDEALSDASGILLAHPYLYPTARALRPDLPMAYDAHNAELVLKDAVLPHSDPGDALRAIVRRVEREAFEASRVVSVCSDEDERLLRKEYGNQRFVQIANGVDLDEVAGIADDDRARASLVWRLAFGRFNPAFTGISHLALFVGSWHPPNLDAVEDIMGYALRLPHVGFLIAGSVCQGFRDRPRPRNVVLLGMVSDEMKRTLLKACDVALNPMTRGSGTNLKIVEYFAAELPTVSTEIGARGLGARNGIEVIIAEPLDFPDAIQQVLDDRETAAEVGRRARLVAEDGFDWRKLGADLLVALCDAFELEPVAV